MALVGEAKGGGRFQGWVWPPPHILLESDYSLLFWAGEALSERGNRWRFPFFVRVNLVLLIKRL